jgi:hypothetical protein
MRAIDISSKEAYLAWVQEWKEEYKNVSESIRHLRVRLSEPHEIELINTSYGHVFYSKASKLQGAKHDLRWKAKFMLEQRHEGKKQSWAAKQEAKLNA